MTKKQIRKAADELHELVRTSGQSEQTEQIRKELSCRGMINSILIYGDPLFERDGRINTYLRDYAEKRADGRFSNWLYLGMERVKQLIEEQKADFAKAKVSIGVYADEEGCTYNSCKWADE